MRLINAFTFKFCPEDEFDQPYVTLSDVEDAEDVTFQDAVLGRFPDPGFKLTGLARLAKRGGHSRIWLDTCCIDASSSAELEEAIYSMYRWYEQATHCYVYLSDVRDTNDHAAFMRSRWFKQGWTLQALLASRSLSFHTAGFEFIGTKDDLMLQIRKITGIPLAALRGASLSEFSVEERLRWAEGRHTELVEDKAYCMMGILGVHMPILYGEGEKAMEHLLQEVGLQAPAGTRTLESSRTLNAEQTVPVDNNGQSTSPSSANDDEHRTAAKIQRHGLYAPLKHNEFRLLAIEPGAHGQPLTGSLEEYDFSTAPAYHALSYVWGQDPQIHPTEINGESVLTQPNLFHALQRFRLPSGTFHIWADNLCINQTDIAERSLQVSQMGTIYSSASGVLIWLGEEDSTSKLALNFLTKITSQTFRWSAQWWEEPGFAAIMQLVDRPWFRRGWVIQEATFSRNSIIRCGDQEIHFDHFTTAMNAIRDRLSTVILTSRQPLAHFKSSAAVKLVEIVTGCLKQLADGSTRYTMSLETLVIRTLHCETSDPRDAIYALLNLANNTSSSSDSDSISITADYTKPVLDTFADFIMHCCRQSGQLDIICRPWVPRSTISMSSPVPNSHTSVQLRAYPSWLVTRDKLPYGLPSERQRHRASAEPLASRGKARCYFAHYGTRAKVSIGRSSDGLCDGSLRVKGLIVGKIVRRSTRMAHAIVTKECLDILDSDPESDTVWRTLCADRDEHGERAPSVYKDAMLQVLQLSSEVGADQSVGRLSGIDPEELLGSEPSEEVESFVKVIQGVLWNRRIIRIGGRDDASTTIVGLSPQHSRNGDHVCILYGCSVPVVLRKINDDEWQLIGDAYVHGMMDGEAISSGGPRRFQEQEFVIR